MEHGMTSSVLKMINNGQMDLHIIYRISNNSYDKVREPYATKENCLKNALRAFPPSGEIQWIILGDALQGTTEGMIRQAIRGLEYARFELVNSGGNAASFNMALDLALGTNGDGLVYFLEDDYLHVLPCAHLIEEGLIGVGADYVSLYDHPDKYLPASLGGNPFIDETGGEPTRVFKGMTRHWKLTNSTTMTFAARTGIIREDEAILRKWTALACPRDFQLFTELKENGRQLITPLPGASTHGETAWLSPFIEWEKEI
jgi:hypothetical protein